MRFKAEIEHRGLVFNDSHAVLHFVILFAKGKTSPLKHRICITGDKTNAFAQLLINKALASAIAKRAADKAASSRRTPERLE